MVGALAPEISVNEKIFKYSNLSWNNAAFTYNLHAYPCPL